MRPVPVLKLAAALLLLQGCAGLGYSLGRTSATIGPDSGSLGRSLASTKAMTYATSYHQFRVIDTSGVLLSALVNVSRQQLAREKAIEQARAEGKKAGTFVEYSYEPMAAVPGMRVTVDLRLGFGAPTTTYSAYAANPELVPAWTSDESRYFGFDIAGELFGWRSETMPLSIAGGFSGRIDRLAITAPSPSFEFQTFGSDLYAFANAGYELTPNVVVSAGTHFGLVSPLMYLIIGTDDTPVFASWSAAELAWRPVRFLSVSAEVRYGRYPSLTRTVSQTMAGLNAMATF